MSRRAWIFAAAACALVATAQGARLGAIAPTPADAGAAVASLPPPRVPIDPNAQCLPLHAPLPPPVRKPPPELGWVRVHADGAQGQVFVAARPWGEPETTILAPCGKYYVNVARTDRKGNWRGWQAIGQVVSIPCDGTIAEVSLARPSVTSFTPIARTKPRVEACSWPTSQP